MKSESVLSHDHVDGAYLPMWTCTRRLPGRRSGHWRCRRLAGAWMQVVRRTTSQHWRFAGEQQHDAMHGHPWWCKIDSPLCGR